MLEEQLKLLHPFIVHVSIVCIMLSFITAMAAYVLHLVTNTKSNNGLIAKFRFSSIFLLIISVITLPMSIATGFIDAGSFHNASNDPVLSFKIQMSFLLVFLLVTPLTIYFYSLRLDFKLFEDEYLFTTLYVLFLTISNGIVFVIGAAGGYYNYGHSFFDTIGFGSEFQDLFGYQTTQSVYDSFLPSILTGLVYLLIIALPLFFKKK